MSEKFSRYDSADYLKTDEDMALYFAACLEENDPALIAHALGVIARAKGMTYYYEDDTLVIHLSDKPIVREVSQDWNTHISYAADGTTVKVVVLDARSSGAYPMAVEHAQAA